MLYSCNTNSRPPPTIQVALAGGDSFANSVLRSYVEQFSAKSPDWQAYIKFFFIPFGNYLCLNDIYVILCLYKVR